MSDIYLHFEKFNDMDIIEHNDVKGVFLPINSNNIKLLKTHTTIKLKTFTVSTERFCKTDCVFISPDKDGNKINPNIIGNMKTYPPNKKKFDANIYKKTKLTSLDNLLEEK